MILVREEDVGEMQKKIQFLEAFKLERILAGKISKI